MVALLVPLDGGVELIAQGKSLRVTPPYWEEDANGEPRLLAQDPPLAVPFGARHTVRTHGPGTACWAYVFGVADDELIAQSRRLHPGISLYD